MVLERRDLEILRLAGKCRWFPLAGLDRYGLGSLTEEIILLSQIGLMTIARSREYVMLTQKGYEYLTTLGYPYAPSKKRAYADSVFLRRRLETAWIILTCLRAGIDTLRDNVEALRDQPVFLPAFDLRGGLGNMMNAASCAGFGHWGNAAYMFQYVSEQTPSMYLANELSHLHRLSSIFDSSKKTPAAMVFAGKSYGDVFWQLKGGFKSKRNGVQGFTDFSEVYETAELPIHLLSCDETGARQLAIMSQPDYKAKIAQAAFGERWNSYDKDLPEADGCVDNTKPLVIVVDMDVRRVNRVCEEARRQGRSKILVAALVNQMEYASFVMLPVNSSDIVVPLGIDQRVLDAAFSSITLYPALNSHGGLMEGSVAYD